MAKKFNTLHDLFVLKLSSLLEIENTLVKALPAMVENSGNEDLEVAFREHLDKTRSHVDRLKQIFEILEEKPHKVDVDAIKGLVSDAEWLIENVEDPRLLDAALISAAQYVEHYEIAGYATAIDWAELLGHDEIQEILTETLAEEDEASEALGDLATSKINGDASEADNMSEED